MIYFLNEYDLSQPDTIPARLTSYVSAQQWMFICQRFGIAPDPSFRPLETSGTSNCFLFCILGCTTCVCTACCFNLTGNAPGGGWDPFIFCDCCGCLNTKEDYLPSNPRTKAIADINAALYMRKPVFSSRLGRIVVDTSNMPVNSIFRQPLVPSYDSAAQNQPYGSGIMMLGANAPAVAYPAPPQYMTFRVPEGAKPGSTVQVAGPNGVLVNVDIPQGVSPGQDILIPF